MKKVRYRMGKRGVIIFFSLVCSLTPRPLLVPLFYFLSLVGKVFFSVFEGEDWKEGEGRGGEGKGGISILFL